MNLSKDLYFYYVILAIMLAGVWCAVSILNSPTGRAFNAIRNSEAASQTLGVPLARTKLIAFVIAAFYPGIGGCLYASLWVSSIRSNSISRDLGPQHHHYHRRRAWLGRGFRHLRSHIFDSAGTPARIQGIQ